MLNIMEIKNKEWKRLKGILEKQLREAGIEFSRIVRVDSKNVHILGGVIPVGFDFEKGDCYAWSKCSRRAGERISIEDLSELETILCEWSYWDVQMYIGIS